MPIKAQTPLTQSPSPFPRFSPHDVPFPAMVRGKRGGGRTRSSSAATGSGPALRGRAPHGRGGRGGRGSAASTPRNTAHTGVVEFDFVVDLHYRPYSRLYLPDSFAAAMANRRPGGFWLQVEDCPNGPSWVVAEYTPDDAILLGRGWKAFARSRRLSKGQFLAFRFDGDQTLLVKIYRSSGGQIECCAESESSGRITSSFNEDEDEESSSNVKAEASWSH